MSVQQNLGWWLGLGAAVCGVAALLIALIGAWRGNVLARNQLVLYAAIIAISLAGVYGESVAGTVLRAAGLLLLLLFFALHWTGKGP